jgi:hypothetical protein
MDQYILLYVFLHIEGHHVLEQRRMKAQAKRISSSKSGKHVAPISSRVPAPQRERVLIEFPSGLLRRTDEAARKLEKNRSELIRGAVEKLLNDMDSSEFERELAAAYAANAEVSREMMKEFEAVDREGF